MVITKTIVLSIISFITVGSFNGAGRNANECGDGGGTPNVLCHVKVRAASLWEESVIVHFMMMISGGVSY